MSAEESFELIPRWAPAPGVVSTDLGATWCALEIRIKGLPVTLVTGVGETSDRRSLHVSAYPLAEWIATRWWALTGNHRPSAVPVETWTWMNVRRQPWLRNHNLRGAGDGMAWPDLTVVPEGALSRLVWRAGPGMFGQPVTFLAGGDTYLPGDVVRSALAGFVLAVLDRLDEAGVTGTPLHKEWAALGDLDVEELDFAAAAARLGLDPFDLEPRVADTIVRLAELTDRPLFGELLDSADPARLDVAHRWLERAMDAPEAAGTAPVNLPGSALDGRRLPWLAGYDLARECRARTGVQPVNRFPLEELVGLVPLAGDTAGLEGLARNVQQRVAVVLPDEPRRPETTRFAQARALGLSLLTDRHAILLNLVSTDLTKASRAFAAELIAPSAGIAEYLAALGSVSDRGFDAIADRYGASPLVIAHQYANQLAATRA